MVKTRPFDAAEYLDSPETIAAYLSEAFETGDPAFITEALGTIARAAMHRAHNAESVAKRLFEENALMRSVIEAGDDLYASLAECDDHELSKFQRESVKTYAKVSNAYRNPHPGRPKEKVPYKVPHIVINEEAHGQD